MEGVCCECQSVHLVSPAPQRDDLNWDEEGDFEEQSFFVMATHDAYGSHCNGSGETPQAVLKDGI